MQIKYLSLTIFPDETLCRLSTAVKAQNRLARSFSCIPPRMNLIELTLPLRHSTTLETTALNKNVWQIGQTHSRRSLVSGPKVSPSRYFSTSTPKSFFFTCIGILNIFFSPAIVTRRYPSESCARIYIIICSFHYHTLM